MMPKYALFF